MSDTSAAHEFTIVRRGYDREQVDGHVARLVSERDQALARIGLLEKRVEELQRQTQDGSAVSARDDPSRPPHSRMATSSVRPRGG